MSKRFRARCRGIPVRNIYYMMCYALRCQDLLDSCPSDDDGEFEGVTELMSFLVARESFRLVESGLVRDYHEKSEELQTPRGRIEMAASFALCARKKLALACESDDYTADQDMNGMIAFTLDRIKGGHAKTDAFLREVRPLFDGIRKVEPTRERIARLSFDRRTSRYRFVISLCSLLHDRRLPIDRMGGQIMSEVERTRLNYLFEGFVRSFYRQELPRSKGSSYSVWEGGREVSWAVKPDSPQSALMPRMITDVWIERVLDDRRRRLFVIDAKFYHDALGGSTTFRSPHLYQLFSYLCNAKLELGKNLEDLHGCLLYPLNGTPLCEDVALAVGDMHVRTVDLDNEWTDIAANMLELFDNMDG